MEDFDLVEWLKSTIESEYEASCMTGDIADQHRHIDRAEMLEEVIAMLNERVAV